MTISMKMSSPTITLTAGEIRQILNQAIAQQFPGFDVGNIVFAVVEQQRGPAELASCTATLIRKPVTPSCPN